MAGAQEYTPGGSLNKKYNADAYGVYGGAGGGLSKASGGLSKPGGVGGLGGFTKVSRKESRGSDSRKGSR